MKWNWMIHTNVWNTNVDNEHGCSCPLSCCRFESLSLRKCNSWPQLRATLTHSKQIYPDDRVMRRSALTPYSAACCILSSMPEAMHDPFPLRAESSWRQSVRDQIWVETLLRCLLRLIIQISWLQLVALPTNCDVASMASCYLPIAYAATYVGVGSNTCRHSIRRTVPPASHQGKHPVHQNPGSHRPDRYQCGHEGRRHTHLSSRLPWDGDLGVMLRSDFVAADTSDKSPRKLFIFDTNNDVRRIKVSQNHLI